MSASSPQNFIVTPWSLLLTQGERGRSLDILCQNYREPVLKFFRRHSCDPEDSEDLTQAFFAYVIEKKIHLKANPERGRFRTFILTAAQNFLRNRRRREKAQKRFGEHEFSMDQISMSESTSDVQLSNTMSPDQIFDQSWAMTLFDQVWGQLENEYQERGDEERFESFAPCLMMDSDRVPYRKLSEKFGISEAGIKSAVFRLRERFRELFRNAISRLVEDPRDVDDEITYLLKMIRGV